jgi:succinate dehydrogenase / fumarate reductase, iron-sulfur subunit
VMINGRAGLACHTHLGEALKGGREGVIEVEPFNNMPVIKDLVVDMDAVHWKKIQRVTPWLINKEPVPEREYIVPHENMVDVTQSMACIQCGACVASCLSMEVDPLFVGPAALAKSYRFVGDPRDAQQYERLKDLAEDPHGMYDCTHCFNCIEACPKGVAPMNQIMRLRRVSGNDHHIVDRNNGDRHERAFATLVKGHGLLHEAELLPRSYGGDSWFGKFAPPAGLELIDSLPVITKALLRRKVTPKGALLGHKIPKDDLKDVQRIFDVVEGKDERYELNLYISGYDEDGAGEGAGDGSVMAETGTGDGAGNAAEQGSPGLAPEDSPTR